MKKAIGLIALLCIVAVLASCATALPDPATAVDLYFAEISNSDSDYANEIKGEMETEYLEMYPGAKQACYDFVDAYLNSFEYEVHKDKTEIDKEAKTAKVYVTYSCADVVTLMTEVSTSSELMEFTYENATDLDAIMAFMFELIAEKINSGEGTPITVEATVEVQYDSDQQVWVITNEDDVFADLF